MKKFKNRNTLKISEYFVSAFISFIYSYCCCEKLCSSQLLLYLLIVKNVQKCLLLKTKTLFGDGK